MPDRSHAADPARPTRSRPTFLLRRPGPTRAVLLVVALAAMALTGCADHSGGGTTKDGLRKLRVVLDWTPNTNHSGMYLAEAKGWYRQAGLAVTFVEPGDSDPLELLAAGRADIAVSVSEAVVPARAQGLPVQSVAAIIQHNTSGLISLAGAHITRPRDLEGKTYGQFGGAIERPLIDQLITCDGGDPSKVRFVDAGEADYRVGLQHHTYDAVWIFDGWDAIQLDQIDKLKTNEIRFADHTGCIPDWYTPVLATSTHVETSRPKDLRAFLAATSRGYQAAMTDPAAATDALLKAAPGLDRNLVSRSARYLSTRYTDTPAAWGRQDPKVWAAFGRFLVRSKIVKGHVDISQAWTDAYLPKGT